MRTESEITRAVNEAVDWDSRKTLSDVWQDHARIERLDDATYEALIAVAQWGARTVLERDDEDNVRDERDRLRAQYEALRAQISHALATESETEGQTPTEARWSVAYAMREALRNTA